MIDLSILVCSVHNRYDSFLLKIEKQLFEQYGELSEADQERVEIVVLTDNKKMMLGHKRNVMVDMAQGKYVVFVDDDDRVASDYIAALLKATTFDRDVIVFKAEVSLNGEPPKLCHYSKEVKRDYNNREGYHRIPNHICCVKKELSLKSSFPNVLYGEDAGYGKLLLPHLKSEFRLDRVLYYYDYSLETTETQAWRQNKAKVKQGKPLVDVVILSKALDDKGKAMTQNAIDSCRNSSNGLPINVIVVENGDQEYEYSNALTTYRPGAFNYNEFANTAAAIGSAEWLMIANNDLTFHDGWLHHLIAAGNDVVSPHEPRDLRQIGIKVNTLGDVCGKHFSGWCFMIKRKLWLAIGGFDTRVSFWCSDDVVIEQVKAMGVEPMLVAESLVSHKPSTTLRALPTEEQEAITWGNVYIFNKEYGKDKFSDNPRYLDWLKRSGKL